MGVVCLGLLWGQATMYDILCVPIMALSRVFCSYMYVQFGYLLPIPSQYPAFCSSEVTSRCHSGCIANANYAIEDGHDSSQAREERVVTVTETLPPLLELATTSCKPPGFVQAPDACCAQIETVDHDSPQKSVAICSNYCAQSHRLTLKFDGSLVLHRRVRVLNAKY